MTEAELKKMTVKQLRDLATGKTEIQGLTGMKKEELVNALMEELKIKIGEKDPVAEKKAVVLDSKSAKNEIMRLKQKISDLLGGKSSNPKQLKNIRRRVRNLKRIMRKVS